jgi:hypothetical protein
MRSFALRWSWLVLGGVGLVVWGLQQAPAALAPKSATNARAPVRASFATSLRRARQLSVDLNVTNMPAIAVHAPRTGVAPQGFFFDPAVTYPTGDEQAAVAVGDISGDGRSDVVAAVSNQGADNAVLIFRQAEDGTLLAPDRYQTAEYSQSSAIAIVDLDNDGDQDIVVGYHDSLMVLLNSPSAMAMSFRAAETPNGYTRVAALDVNGDGFKDIAAVNSEYGTDVFINDGAGALTAGQHVGTPLAIRDVSVGDLTNDGVDDLVVQYYKSELLVYPAGAGGLAAPIKLAYPVDGTDPDTHVLADFNGDGRLDVAMNDRRSWDLYPYGPDYMRVYIRDGEGNLSVGWRAPSISVTYASSLATADLDGNGRYDLVSIAASEDMSYLLLGAKGFKSEVRMPRLPEWHQYANNGFAVGNVIGDDCLDVVVPTLWATGYGISVYRGRNCSHSLAPTIAAPLSFPPRR